MNEKYKRIAKMVAEFIVFWFLSVIAGMIGLFPHAFIVTYTLKLPLWSTPIFSGGITAIFMSLSVLSSSIRWKRKQLEFGIQMDNE